MTKPPEPTSRPRKRSRLFQAAPEALFVEEWVPNITLPPPPDAPLVEEEGVVQLDEHGLPERQEEEEEPEEERRGPARIYVGKGAATKAKGPVAGDELPVSDVELPDLSLPSAPGFEDNEEGSDPSLPDLSIDGSGSNWGSMFDDLDDDENPTDPELRSGDAEPSADSEPLAMPAATSREPEAPDSSADHDAPKPAPAASAAPPVTPAPKLDRPGPATPLTTKPDRPRPAAVLDAKPTPSWARSSKSQAGPAIKPEGGPKPQPPRIRPTQPKPPEPGLGSMVPRVMIIAIVVLVILMLLVWVARRPSTDPVGETTQPPAPAGTHELTIQPGAMDLAAPPEPAEEPPPVEATHAPEPVEEPESVAAPAPAPAPAPTAVERKPEPSRTTARTIPAPTPRTPPPLPEPEPEPAAVATGDGFLVVESDRYAMIYMGGRRLGGTPIARMELEPGSYAVRAVCRDTGATKTMQVEVEAGELSTAAFRFMP